MVHTSQTLPLEWEVSRCPLLSHLARRGRSSHWAYWYNSLDPDSYDLRADEEGEGVYWCGDPQCHNYYGYFKRLSLFLHGVDYWRESALSRSQTPTPPPSYQEVPGVAPLEQSG